MIIEAVQDYTDLKLKKKIKLGEQYKVSQKRGKEILLAKFNKKPLAKLVEVIEKKPKNKKEKE